MTDSEPPMAASTGPLDRQRFNQWSKTYETSHLQWLLFERVHRAILKQLPAGFIPCAVLDIGCGTGRLLRRMHEAWPGASMIGIDLSDGMVARAHQLSPFAAIYQAPAEHLPLKSGSVDLATSTVSFHHWSDQEQGVGEIQRVLYKGGLFILADPNLGHGHPLSRQQLRELFQACGLLVRKQVYFLPFFSITMAEKQ